MKTYVTMKQLRKYIHKDLIFNSSHFEKASDVLYSTGFAFTILNNDEYS